MKNIFKLFCGKDKGANAIVKNIKPSNNTTIIVPYNNVQYNNSCECNKK